MADEIVGQDPEKWNAAITRQRQLEAQRAQVVTQYPLLSRVEPAKFNEMSESEKVAKLREACGGVLQDINTTRQNIMEGKINLMSLPLIVGMTNAGLGIQPQQAEWIAQRIQSDRRWDIGGKIAIAALAIGLGIGATLLSGGALGGPAMQGVGAVMGWAGFGIGLTGAISTTDEFFVNQAGTNTRLDASKSLLPQEMKGHWGWVVASWGGAGLDLGAAVHAMRMLKLGMSVEDVVRQTARLHPDVNPNTLRQVYMTAAEGKTNPKLLAQLKEKMSPEDYQRLEASLNATAPRTAGRPPEQALAPQATPKPPEQIPQPQRTPSEIANKKFDYLFGRATGRPYNLDPTNQNALEMKRLGVPDTPEGKATLRVHLDSAVQGQSNIVRTFKNEWGTFEVRESLFAVPSGKFSKFESTWQVMPDGTRRFSTLIPMGGSKK